MSQARALLLMHAATVLFGISAVLGRLIASSAEVIVFGRTAFALVALGLALSARPGQVRWARLGPAEIGRLLLVGALLGAHWMAFFLAVKVGNVAVATLGFASFPAFVAVLEAVFSKDRLTRGELLLIALVSLGLVLVTPAFELSDSGTAGLLWGVLSGFLYAVIALANRAAAGRLPSLQVSWWQYVAVVTLLLPVVLPELPNVPALDWLWLAALGFLCTALAYALFIASLSALKATTASIIISLEPVYAIAIAALLLQEFPTIRMLAGGALIIGAVVQAGRRKAAAPVTEPAGTDIRRRPAARR